MATSAQNWDAAKRWQSYRGIKNPAADWLARFRPYVEDAKGSCGGGDRPPAVIVPSYAIRRPRPPKGEIQWHENEPLMERGVGQVRNVG